MVLAAVVMELFLYGFLGAYLTHSFGFPFTIFTILWFYNTVIAIHRNDPFNEADGAAALIIDLNFTTPISFVFGVACGLIYAWAFQFVPRLRWEFWTVGWRLVDAPLTGANANELRRVPVFVFDTLFTWFGLAAALAGVAGNFLLGNYQPEVSSSMSLALGIVGIVLGAGGALYILFRWYTSDQPSDWLTFLYALAIIFYMLTPAVYDFLLSIRPFQQVLFHIALLLVTIVFAVLNVNYFSRRNERELALLANDVRAAPSQTTKGRIWAYWFTLYLPIFVVYLAGGITGELTLTTVNGKDERIGDLDSVAVVVFLTAVVVALIGLVIGYFRWRSPDKADWWISRADQTNRIINSNDDDERTALTTTRAAGAAYEQPAVATRTTTAVVRSRRPAMSAALAALQVKRH